MLIHGSQFLYRKIAICCSRPALDRLRSPNNGLFRFFTSSRPNMSSLKAEQRYKLKDKMSEQFQLIYRAPMENYLKSCKFVSNGSLLVVGSLLAMSACSTFGLDLSLFGSELTKPIPVNYGSLVTSEAEIVILALGFLAINVLIRLMISKYPLRIYKNKNKYVAVFENQIPFKENKINYIKGETREIPPKGILPWRECIYRIKNKDVILLPPHFKTPSELHIMVKRQ